MSAETPLSSDRLEEIRRDFAEWDRLKPSGPFVYYEIAPDAFRDILSEIDRLSTENAGLRVDGERLDAISVPGAKARVYMNALANQADPPMQRRAEVHIPSGPHAACTSVRSTLRAAIDAARSPRSKGE